MFITDMLEIFKISHLANDSVHLIGLHGIGKSRIVESFAKKNNYHLEILMLAQQEPADLIGIPYEVDGVQYWAKPPWLHRMEEANKAGKHCILFLDELARALLEVRQSIMQLVLDKKLHEHILPVLDGLETLVVAADNPPELYDTEELDKALQDRFATYEIEISAKDWITWAKETGVNDVVIDYIAMNPDNIHQMYEDEKGPTPRSLEKLSDYLNKLSEVSISDNLLKQICMAKIGVTTGLHFHNFYKDYIKIVKVQDIVDYIGDVEIKTAEQQIAASKNLYRLTGTLEAEALHSLAERIKKEIETNNLSYDILTVFMGSLNMEICTSIYRAWKDSKTSTEEEFYYTWSKTMPERWIFKRNLVVAGELEKTGFKF